MARVKTPGELERKAEARKEYLAEGKRRMLIRKKNRHNKAVVKHERYRAMNQCEMGYAGCYGWNCNGDC